MYSSLKSWMNIPVRIMPFTKRTGTGAKVFGEYFTTNSYILGESVVVKDQDGQEAVSNTQVYLDGSEKISVLDKITLDGVDYDIKSISTFYRNGKPDIKVVYL